MNRLTELIDKYLVPVYQKEGWVPVAVFLLLGVGIIFFSVWLGFGDVVKGLLGE